ncbi:MAG: hypothetical protein L6Q72_15025 [Burkholderiaceae bacterium]|nr:hypothetical protein [Burkholderiaceae bacterium]GIL05607.1 MAG: hypothetical protein BroJett031_21270 [Betaproteobacteria bacterium]
MRPSTIEPPLRLGLAFFSDEDERFVRALVVSMASEVLPWVVADEAPVHALLLARGLRRRDAEDAAILLLGADAAAEATRLYGDAMPPIALRKPLRPSHLKIVLEMAAASLVPEHVAGLLPQTRPRVDVEFDPLAFR